MSNAHLKSGSSAVTFSRSRSALVGNQPTSTQVLFLAAEDQWSYYAYAWSGFGLGSIYANPVNAPQTYIRQIMVSEDNTMVTNAPSNTGMNIFQWLGSGWGIGLPSTSVQTTSQTSTNQSRISPDNRQIVVGWNASPYVYVAPVNSTTGSGTRYANPITPLSSAVRESRFSANTTALFLAIGISPFVNTYAFSTVEPSIGVKYTTPVTSMTSASTTIRVTPDNRYVAFSTSPISVYEWSDYTGFGVKLTNPVDMVAGANHLAFSKSGDAILVGYGVLPAVYVWRWSSLGFGTKYANPATNPPNPSGPRVSMSSAQDAVAMMSTASPFLNLYAWSPSSGFGTKYPGLSVLPGANVVDVAFSN